MKKYWNIVATTLVATLFVGCSLAYVEPSNSHTTYEKAFNAETKAEREVLFAKAAEEGNMRAWVIVGGFDNYLKAAENGIVIPDKFGWDLASKSREIYNSLAENFKGKAAIARADYDYKLSSYYEKQMYKYKNKTCKMDILIHNNIFNSNSEYQATQIQIEHFKKTGNHLICD